MNKQEEVKLNVDKTYSDYEKLMPTTELPRYLFDYFHIFEGIALIKDPGKELFYQELEIIINKYNKYKLFTDFLDSFFLKLIKRYKKNNSLNLKKDKKIILFQSFKYSDIILGTKKYQQVGLIAHGKRDRLFAIQNFIGYIITNDLDQYVLAYLKGKNIKYLYQLIKKIEDRLEDSKPDYIVLWNDILPIERAILLVSKKLGITTLEIQHGIGDSSLPLGSGKVADYVLVLGEYFKDLYIKQVQRKPEDIYVLGYPHLIKKNQDVKEEDNHYTVCYLGPGLAIYNKDFLSAELETVNSIYKICKKLNLKFIYRPHPGDNRGLLEKKLSDIVFVSNKEKLEETFERAEIFISFSSTSLIEAAMRQKISLQLTNYPIKLLDNFEELGVCNKTLQTFDELENYLAEIVNASDLDKFKLNFNNDYIETRYNPGERFLEIIKEIEKNYQSN